MRVSVIGKYGAYPKKSGGTSSYLVQTKKTNICLDFGCNAMSRIQEMLDVRQISFVVLSHLHFDHIADLGVLNYYLQVNGIKEKLPVYLPASPALNFDSIKSMTCFELIIIEENKVYTSGDVEFTFIKLSHPIENYGVKIISDNKTFAYTGDTNVCENIDSLLRGSNLCLMDGCFLESDWSKNKPHLSAKLCGEYASKHKCKLMLTHINPNVDEVLISRELKKVNDNFIIACEGATYEV